MLEVNNVAMSCKMQKSDLQKLWLNFLLFLMTETQSITEFKISLHQKLCPTGINNQKE